MSNKRHAKSLEMVDEHVQKLGMYLDHLNKQFAQYSEKMQKEQDRFRKSMKKVAMADEKKSKTDPVSGIYPAQNGVVPNVAEARASEGGDTSLDATSGAAEKTTISAEKTSNSTGAKRSLEPEQNDASDDDEKMAPSGTDEKTTGNAVAAGESEGIAATGETGGLETTGEAEDDSGASSDTEAKEEADDSEDPNPEGQKKKRAKIYPPRKMDDPTDAGMRLAKEPVAIPDKGLREDWESINRGNLWEYVGSDSRHYFLYLNENDQYVVLPAKHVAKVFAFPLEHNGKGYKLAPAGARKYGNRYRDKEERVHAIYPDDYYENKLKGTIDLGKAAPRLKTVYGF